MADPSLRWDHGGSSCTYTRTWTAAGQPAQTPGICATPDRVDLLVAKARENGWTLLFPDRHPHAGGSHQHAAYLESRDGFEIELVAPLTA